MRGQDGVYIGGQSGANVSVKSAVNIERQDERGFIDSYRLPMNPLSGSDTN